MKEKIIILTLLCGIFYNFSIYSQAIYVSEDLGEVSLEIIRFYENEIIKKFSDTLELIPISSFIEKNFRKTKFCSIKNFRIKEFKNFKENLENARRVFYEENNLEKCKKILDTEMERFFKDPCILYDNQQFLKELFQYGVLKVWVEILSGNDEKVESFIKKLALAFPEEKPDLENFPPEVCKKFEEVKNKSLISFGAIEFNFFPKEIEKQCKIFLNGKEYGTGNITIPKIASGSYVFQPVCEEIAGFRRNIEIKDKKIVLNILWPLEKSFEMSDRITWEGAPHSEKEFEELAKAFFEFKGVKTIIGARFISEPFSEKVQLFLLNYSLENRKLKESFAFEFSKSSKPFPPIKVKKEIKKAKKIWSYILLGAGGLFSGAGIYFNILANQNVKEINRGINSLEDYRMNKGLMWASYSAGGASIIGGVILFFFIEKKEEGIWKRISFSPINNKSLFFSIKF